MDNDDHSVDFAELGLSDALLTTLREVGYETPSPIQAATIPPLLAGRDVVGLAQTGTGKTAAFALPILQGLDPHQRTPQALVLAPTRELALQVCEAFERYAGHLPQIRVLPIYGGQAYGPQLSALKRGVHIVVGTPGRVIDHLRKGTLNLTELRFLVLDEADEMLNMGFAEDVETILADTPANKNLALCSATMPPQIRRMATRYLDEPFEIILKSKTTTSANTAQRYLVVSYPQKVEALTRILEVEAFDGMIVFVRTKNETETLAEKLRARGFSAMAINGDMGQVQRERTVAQLKSGQLDILVATDVAARGLDVDRISHVVNFDIPTDTESYVHRIGRTGRAGRSGDAISFVTPRERYLLKSIEKATRQPLTLMPMPTVDDINTSRLARFDAAITQALGSSDLEFYRQVVGHYVNEYDVPEEDVAAALAVVLQGDSPLVLDAEPERVEVHRVPYRIAVGRHHNVEPGQIIGALANEGGLQRRDFGRIEIKSDCSLVGVPLTLPATVRKKLRSTCGDVSGRWRAPRTRPIPRTSQFRRMPSAPTPSGSMRGRDCDRRLPRFHGRSTLATFASRISACSGAVGRARDGTRSRAASR